MSLPPNKNLLKEIKRTNVYVETGIYRGDSIQKAISAGYSNIIGIDNDATCIEFCNKRFDYFKKLPVKLVLGDSAEVLWDAIKDIDEPITFFLDSHWQMLEGTESGKNPFPLLRELDQIARHPRLLGHVIVIDDWHIFYRDRVGYSKKDILDKLDTMGLIQRYNVANPVIDDILIANA